MIRSRISCDDVYKFKKYKTDPMTNKIIGICMVSEKTGKEVCFSNNYAPSEEDIETFKEIVKDPDSLKSYLSVVSNKLEDWQKDIILKESNKN